MAPAKPVSLTTFMRKVPVFGGLEGRSLARVLEVLEEQTFKNGATLFSEGELGRSMYVLREGEVEVLRANNAGKNVPIAYMLKLWSAPDAMIHTSVGVPSTIRSGDPARRASPTGASSLSPRTGSRTKSEATPRSSPGAPATKKATRQP